VDGWSSNFALHHLAAMGNLKNAILNRSTPRTDTAGEETAMSACCSDDVKLTTHLASIVATVYSRP